MQNEPINTGPIQAFIQQVKSADASKAKEVKLSLNDAKNLAFALGIVMSRLHGDLEKFVKENAPKEEVVEVRLGGSGNWT